MATTIFTTGLGGDFHRLTGSHIPVPLDWKSNATVYSGYGIINIQVAIFEGDASYEAIGLIPGKGVTLSDGFNHGSIVSINGFTGRIDRGSSGTHNFHVMFEDAKGNDKPAPPSVAQQFIQALTYINNQPALEDNFFRRVGIFISNENGDFTSDSISYLKWLPQHGEENTGGATGDTGGGNIAPAISGNLARTVLPEGGAPFSQVSVTDANGDNLTLTVGIGDPNRGFFHASSLSGGTYNPATGTYTTSGTTVQVQAALQKLLFVANPRSESASISFEALSFNISVSDGKASTSARLNADMWVNRADTIKGTSRSDKLSGFSGKDKLSGGSGNDKLFGGFGIDSLKGDSGKDAFAFDTRANTRTNKDKITDFKVQDDSIWLDNAVFTKLGRSGSENKPAQLKSSSFTIGDKAKDRNDYIIYNDKKGVLLYDADGSGRGKAVEFATISKNLAMTHKDFFVI